MAKEKMKDEVKWMIAVSLGFVASSLLLSIGIGLVVEKIYVGVLIIIIGYELVRYVFAFLIKKQIANTKQS